MEKKASNRGKLYSIRKEIQRTQLILIIVTTVLLTIGGALININSNKKALDQSLQDTSELITRLYYFLKDYNIL